MLKFSDDAFQRNVRLDSSEEDQISIEEPIENEDFSIHTNGINTCLKTMPSRMALPFSREICVALKVALPNSFLFKLQLSIAGLSIAGKTFTAISCCKKGCLVSLQAVFVIGQIDFQHNARHIVYSIMVGKLTEDVVKSTVAKFSKRRKRSKQCISAGINFVMQKVGYSFIENNIRSFIGVKNFKWKLTKNNLRQMRGKGSCKKKYSVTTNVRR